MKQIQVGLLASTPISEVGLISHLTSWPDCKVLRGEAEVLVMEVERLSADVASTLRHWAADAGTPVVLVIGEIRDTELLTVTRHGVLAILPRRSLTAEQLRHSVRTVVNGGGVMPPSLVGDLVRHLGKLQREMPAPTGRNAADFTSREVDVLRLMADGFDTHEIAGKLYCSDRTIKNIVRSMTQRLELRSRSHAVAYALRAGII